MQCNLQSLDELGEAGFKRCAPRFDLNRWGGTLNSFLQLGGRILDSRDLRSGMSLIAAGLAADGQTRVTPLETVERGYSRLVERLQKLGASVAKI